MTLADYIREDERIEAVRRLKLSRPTDEAKRLFVADYDRIAKNLVRGTPFFSSAQRKLIVERAVEHRLPTMYETRDFVELGGLVSYGADFTDLFRLAAGYIVKILNGVKAGDLPIEQATKFELVINLATAKKLGITVPPVMLGRADEVIE